MANKVKFTYIESTANGSVIFNNLSSYTDHIIIDGNSTGKGTYAYLREQKFYGADVVDTKVDTASRTVEAKDPVVLPQNMGGDLQTEHLLVVKHHTNDLSYLIKDKDRIGYNYWLPSYQGSYLYVPGLRSYEAIINGSVKITTSGNHKVTINDNKVLTEGGPASTSISYGAIKIATYSSYFTGLYPGSLPAGAKASGGTGQQIAPLQIGSNGIAYVTYYNTANTDTDNHCMVLDPIQQQAPFDNYNITGIPNEFFNTSEVLFATQLAYLHPDSTLENSYAYFTNIITNQVYGNASSADYANQLYYIENVDLNNDDIHGAKLLVPFAYSFGDDAIRYTYASNSVLEFMIDSNGVPQGLQFGFHTLAFEDQLSDEKVKQKDFVNPTDVNKRFPVLFGNPESQTDNVYSNVNFAYFNYTPTINGPATYIYGTYFKSQGITVQGKDVLYDAATTTALGGVKVKGTSTYTMPAPAVAASGTTGARVAPLQISSDGWGYVTYYNTGDTNDKTATTQYAGNLNLPILMNTNVTATSADKPKYLKTTTTAAAYINPSTATLYATNMKTTNLTVNGKSVALAEDLVSGLKYKGDITASGAQTALPTTEVAVGDMWIWKKDNATYNTGDILIAYKADPIEWAVVEHNIDDAAIISAINVQNFEPTIDERTAEIASIGGTNITASMAVASQNHIGGIKTVAGGGGTHTFEAGTTTKGGVTTTVSNSKFYPVYLDANNVGYVNVPWTPNDSKTYLASSASNKTNGTVTAATNKIFLNHTENNAITSSIQIQGTGSAKTYSSTAGQLIIYADTNTDVKVEQKAASADYKHPILMKYGTTTDANGYTGAVLYNNNVYINPNSGTLYTTNLLATSVKVNGTNVLTSVPKATTSAIGGIKIKSNAYTGTFSETGKNYQVRIDKDGVAYVNVPAYVRIANATSDYNRPLLMANKTTTGTDAIVDYTLFNNAAYYNPARSYLYAKYTYTTDVKAANISATTSIKKNGVEVATTTELSNAIANVTYSAGAYIAIDNNVISSYAPTYLSDDWESLAEDKLNEQLIPDAGDTFEMAFSKLYKAIIDNERVTAAALNDLDARLRTLAGDMAYLNAHVAWS